MKELTIEEKAKCYDKAINKLRCFMEQGVDPLITRADVQDFFPELKDNEDERIRKGLIEHLKELKEQSVEGSHLKRPEHYDAWIAWIEKQGEHANFRNKIQIGDKVTRNEDGVLVNLSQLNRVAKKDEKQVEQILANSAKPCKDEQNPADKTEPKFKVGNWYQCTKDFFGKGVSFDKNTAYYCAEEGCLKNEYGCHIAIVKDLYDNFKLWTIQDAKDGDVLASKDGRDVVCFKKIDSSASFSSYYNLRERGDFGWSVNRFIPATKEQRDTLMESMTNTGYTFDFEKKKLTKIEQNLPAWSEEDEKEYSRVEYAIMKVFGGDAYLIGWIRKFKNKLPHQTTWKPSEEQMDALYTYIYNPQYFNSPDPRMELVESVFKDLKKLREE